MQDYSERNNGARDGIIRARRSVADHEFIRPFEARFLSFQHFATVRVALSNHSRFSDKAEIPTAEKNL